MDIEFSSADEDDMIMEIDKAERNYADVDFSSADEDEMVKELDRVEKRKYFCDLCNASYSRKANLIRHKLSHKYYVKCSICKRQYQPKDVLKRHMKELHGISNQAFPCNHCSNVYGTYDELFSHIVHNHPLRQQQQPLSTAVTAPPPPPRQMSSAVQPPADQPENREAPVLNALNRTAQVIRLEPRGTDQFDLLAFLANAMSKIRDYLLSRVSSQSVKWYLCLQIELERFNANEDNTRSSPHFRSRTYRDTYSEHDLNEALHKIIESLECFMREGSGWVLKKVLHLEIHTVRYSPLNAKSYIPLPKTLQNKCSVLNIRNFDDNCFEYCVLAALHGLTSTDVSHYLPYRGQLNLQDIPSPVSIAKMDKFENNNPNISINIFGFEQNEIFPLRITKQTGRQHHVNLLYLTQGDKSHYCLIRNLNAFLHRTNASRHKSYYCCYCLNSFSTQFLCDQHSQYCSSNDPQRVELPKPGYNLLQFKDFEKNLARSLHCVC